MISHDIFRVLLRKAPSLALYSKHPSTKKIIYTPRSIRHAQRKWYLVWFYTLTKCMLLDKQFSFYKCAAIIPIGELIWSYAKARSCRKSKGTLMPKPYLLPWWLQDWPRSTAYPLPSKASEQKIAIKSHVLRPVVGECLLSVFLIRTRPQPWPVQEKNSTIFSKSGSRVQPVCKLACSIRDCHT